MAFQNGKILISVDPYEDAENSFDCKFYFETAYVFKSVKM